MQAGLADAALPPLQLNSEGRLKVPIRLLKARLKVLLKTLISLLKAPPMVLLKVLIRLLKARLEGGPPGPPGGGGVGGAPLAALLTGLPVTDGCRHLGATRSLFLPKDLIGK